MKKVRIYILLFAVLGITGCSEEKMAPLPEPVPLRMSINSTDLVMGERWRLLLMSPVRTKV